MEVLAHVDPVVLERELLTRVDAVHPADRGARTLVLVPTNRLVEHLQRKLAEVRPAWLGLEVLPFRSLGREILEQATGRAPHVASALLLEAVLGRLLRECPENCWSSFVRQRPGAAGRVLESVRELREAGIGPDDLAACAVDGRSRDLARLFRGIDAVLGEAADAGWTDDAGLARAAVAHAAGFGKSSRAVFVHGAYELLGVYLDLLRELDRTTEVTVLLPVGRGTRATAFGERFATSFLTDEALSDASEPEDPVRASGLAGLYEENGDAPAPYPASIRFRHSQGPVAEVTFAVREALKAVHDGCSPREIAIVARSLEPFAAALEQALDDAGLVWTSSLSSPLRRHPVVREFLLVLRVVAERFPRGPTVELLQSRKVCWKTLGCDPSAGAMRADVWSREAGVVDGLDEWTTELVSRVGQPRRAADESDEARRQSEQSARRRASGARAIGDALERLDESVSRDDATWGEHSTALIALFDAMFGVRDKAAAGQFRELLDTMSDLEHVVGDRRRVDFEEMRRWLEDAVDSAAATLHREDNGGIRVLDAMQLRGLTFRQVHLVGMNAGLFPRAPREDPVLPDGVRRALRERTGRPIGVKAEAADQEHQLLTMLLGSASERVYVSWQRADESGRAKIASLALREIARLAYGAPDIERARHEALHLPSHPTQWLETLLEYTGLLTPDEERLLASLHSRAADAAETLGGRFVELRPGLQMLRATQSFTPVCADYDARVGAFEREVPLSVSAVETLGQCPLKFFFGAVLGIKPLQAAPSAFELARDELGNRIHEFLQEIYETLHDDGRFTGGGGDELARRGLELVDARRERVFGEIGQRLAKRIPRLWEFETRRWFETVRRFVEDDLRRIGERGLRPASFERLVTALLDLGKGCKETVRGRFDRLLEDDTGRVVGDYKTSTSLSRRVEHRLMLKADTLQVPLYRMMAGPDASVELLGVHPNLDPIDETHRHEFVGFGDDEQKQSFLQTMRVIVSLNRRGVYPFRKDDARCGWCDYANACRRNHPPTVDRERQSSDAADYRAILTKNTRNPRGR